MFSVMNDGHCIGPRRNIFKVTARLRLPNFYDHRILSRTQKLMRKPVRRFEQRTGYGAGAVYYSEYLHGFPGRETRKKPLLGDSYRSALPTMLWLERPQCPAYSG